MRRSDAERWNENPAHFRGANGDSGTLRGSDGTRSFALPRSELRLRDLERGVRLKRCPVFAARRRTSGWFVCPERIESLVGAAMCGGGLGRELTS